MAVDKEPRALATHGAIAALRARKNAAGKPVRYDVAVTTEGDDGRPVPGLQVRVFESGARSFVYRYVVDGQVRRMVIGAFPAVGLKAARERHLAAVRLLKQGIDPQEHKAEQLKHARQERAKREAEITVGALIEEFVADLRERRKAPEQAERMLRVEVLPKWGTRKANEIRRRDAVVLVRAIKRRAPVLANRTAALCVQLFSFAADEGHLEVNPLAGLRRPTKETARERKLDIDEIRTLWYELDARSSTQQGGQLKKGREDRRGTRTTPMLTRPLALAMKLLLVTAQRRGELVLARWDEFTLEGESPEWRIPAERSKNGKPHTVPLSPLALELLREVKALAGDSAYIFPTRLSGRDAPVSDKAVTRAASRNQCGLKHWTPHDLRRTAASHMNRLGVDAIVVEKVLNHSLGGVLQTYNRHTYGNEMHAALDKWGAELRQIIAGRSNVVALPKKRARA